MLSTGKRSHADDRTIHIPASKIARVAEGVNVDQMETIQEYTVTPWEPRLQPTLEASKARGIVITTSSSVKKGIAGIGDCTALNSLRAGRAARPSPYRRLVARGTLFSMASETMEYYSVTLGTREEQNTQ